MYGRRPIVLVAVGFVLVAVVSAPAVAAVQRDLAGRNTSGATGRANAGDDVTITGPSFAVPPSLEDEVEAYRNETSRDLPPHAFVVATESALYLVFADREPSTGIATVSGSRVEDSLLADGLNFTAVRADTASFETNGTPTTVGAVVDDPGKYQHELVRIDATHRRVTSLTDPDAGANLTAASSSGVLVENASTPGFSFEVPVAAARSLSVNASTDELGRNASSEVDSLLGSDARLSTFDLAGGFWTDANATVDGVVLAPGSVARDFVATYDESGIVRANDSGPLLYVVDATRDPARYEDVPSLVGTADDGDVVSVEANLYGGRISVQETVETTTGCGVDLFEVGTPSGPTCVDVVQDDLVYAGAAWSGTPDDPEEVLFVAGIASRHRDRPVSNLSGRYRVVGEVVPTDRFDPSLPDGRVLVVYGLERTGDLDFDAVDPATRAAVRARYDDLNRSVQARVRGPDGDPDAVNVTQYGTHPPLSETGGSPSPDAVSAFGPDRVVPDPPPGTTPRADAYFQVVPRDGATVDVVRVEANDAGEPVNASVDLELNDELSSSGTGRFPAWNGDPDGAPDDAFAGSVLGVLDPNNSTLVDASGDGARVYTGDDGVAYVLVGTDRSSEDLYARTDASLTADPGATDASNVTFRGVSRVDRGSIAGSVTDRSDVSVGDTFVYVAAFRWGDDAHLVRVRPVGGTGAVRSTDFTDLDDVGDLEFEVVHYYERGYAGPGDPDATIADPVPGDRVASTVVPATAISNVAGPADFEFGPAFPAVDSNGPYKLAEYSGPGDDTFTIKDVPAAADPSIPRPNPTTTYEVRGVQLVTTADPLGNASASTRPSFTGEANIAFDFAARVQFRVESFSAPDSVDEGASFSVTARVNNTGTVRGTRTVGYRIDLDDDGSLEPGERVAANETTLDPAAPETVRFVVPAGATDGLNGSDIRHGALTGDDARTSTIIVVPASGLPSPVDVNGDGNRSKDGTPPADDRYQDVEGDRDTDIFDVLAFFEDVTGSGEQATARNSLYDFDGDGDVDIFDVQTLFEAVTGTG